MRTYGWVVGVAAAAGFAAGCNNQPAATPYAESEANAHDEHDHAHEHGPHGGHVVELADDHSTHGEFVVDEAGKVAKFYVLGGDLKTPVEATAVTMHAETAEGGENEVAFTPVGGGEKASEFTAPLDQFPTADVEKMHGHFHVTVAGKELNGDLSHDHDHEDGHDHEEHAEPAMK